MLFSLCFLFCATIDILCGFFLFALSVYFSYSNPCFPIQLRSMCHCLYQVVSQRFPEGAIDSLGTVLFLRFYNPVIGKYIQATWCPDSRNMFLCVVCMVWLCVVLTPWCCWMLLSYHNLKSAALIGRFVSYHIRFPPKLRSMCHCQYQVVTQRFQQSTVEAVWTVIGTVIFLRFINPAIGKETSAGPYLCLCVSVCACVWQRYTNEWLLTKLAVFLIDFSKLFV